MEFVWLLVYCLLERAWRAHFVKDFPKPVVLVPLVVMEVIGAVGNPSVCTECHSLGAPFWLRMNSWALLDLFPYFRLLLLFHAPGSRGFSAGWLHKYFATESCLYRQRSALRRGWKISPQHCGTTWLHSLFFPTPLLTGRWLSSSEPQGLIHKCGSHFFLL